MNYLVLGSSGFIGRHLTTALLNQGERVTAFDMNQGTGLVHPKLRFVEGSFSQDYNFEKLVRGQDVVFHLISTTFPNSNPDLRDEISENVFSTLALLDACVKEQVKRVVFVSSGGTVYGNNTDGQPFSEQHTTLPISSYGIQKLMIEKYLHLYHHKFNLDYRVVRLANPYGPGQNPKGAVGAVTVFLDRVMNHQPITIFGDGSSVRDYIFIDDAIEGLINVSKDTSQHKLYNLGSGVGISLNTILMEIQDLLKEKAELTYLPQRDSDVNYSVLDTDLYQSEFKEHRFTKLQKGISLLYDSMKEKEK